MIDRRRFLTSTARFAGTVAWMGAKQTKGMHFDRPLMAYVGTFSSPLKDVLPTQVDLPPGNGRGIHLFQIQRRDGTMIPAGAFDLGTSPSCLAANRAATHLYSANETDRVGDDRQGTVSAFSIDPNNGDLKLLNTVRSGGAGPTYVAVHPSQRYLLVANYFGGSIAVLPIQSDGRIGEPCEIIQDQGDLGPTRAQHAPAGSFAFSGHDRTHAHMIESDPQGRFVLHVDLGLDRIFVWAFDPQSGKLKPAKIPFVALPPGDGPRHFHFHPSGKWFVSIQEEGSTLVRFEYDESTGALTPKQTISSLPPGYAGSNFCSEVLYTRDGRFLYAGNRLHDSIGIFSVGAQGELAYVGEEWTRGNYPRSFAFDPTGHYLYCCNQRADHVTVFEVDIATGKLRFTGQYVPVGNPSMVCFVDLADRK
jgi:6-phosphogluconolactonase